MIQPADRLQFTPAELLGQQGQHARMMTGLARTFEVGRLVEHDVHALAIAPCFIENGEFQIGGIEAGTIVINDFIAHGDFTIFDQAATVFTGTETLRLQDAVQGQFAHGGTLSERLIAVIADLPLYAPSMHYPCATNAHSRTDSL